VALTKEVPVRGAHERAPGKDCRQCQLIATEETDLNPTAARH
jgi:hypothetical protein